MPASCEQTKGCSILLGELPGGWNGWGKSRESTGKTVPVRSDEGQSQSIRSDGQEEIIHQGIGTNAVPDSYRDVEEQQFSIRTVGEGVMSLIWNILIWRIYGKQLPISFLLLFVQSLYIPHTLFHLITYLVTLGKGHVVSPTFYMWDIGTSERLWNSCKVTQQVRDTADLWLSTPIWPVLSYAPSLLQPTFSKMAAKKILQTHLFIKIISSWRKEQGEWLNPMLIYFGRLFTRLFKELSDSANFNQVIVEQPWIPPWKAKYKHKWMTQHKTAVVLPAAHYRHHKMDE